MSSEFDASEFVDSDFQSARKTEIGTPQNFFAPRTNQTAMAGLITNLPLAAKIHVLQEPAAYPMTYLSGRALRSFPQPFKTSNDDYLLVQPSDYSIWPASWAMIGWLQENTNLVARRGEYSLYRLREGVLRPLQ